MVYYVILHARPASLLPPQVDALLTCLNSLKEHLRALDKIGKKNNGNRAFGTKGYSESSEYVLSQITQKKDKDFKVWTQEFNHTYEETREISITGPDSEDVEVLSLMYNNATPLPGGATGEIVAVPVDDTAGTWMRSRKSTIICR